MGAMARQGPHQAAQKSSSTGLSDFNTSESKLASVTSTVVLLAIHPPGFGDYDFSRLTIFRNVDCSVSIGRTFYRSTDDWMLPGRRTTQQAEPAPASDHRGS